MGIYVLIVFKKGFNKCMHVISRKCLNEFGTSHPDIRGELYTWFHMMERKNYPSPITIKEVFGSADIIPGDRVVFNIKGNSYRIIVKSKIFYTKLCSSDS